MQKFAFFVNLLKKPYICSERNSGMEIIFNEAYLLEIYKTGLSDKKHRFQPQIIRKYIRVLI